MSEIGQWYKVKACYFMTKGILDDYLVADCDQFVRHFGDENHLYVYFLCVFFKKGCLQPVLAHATSFNFS